ncbi:Transcriptional regulator, RofA [Streptococcus agalactiae]|uniref:Transcriptional regulator, RofA n=1 Tax=Streptococcus agalactiae TaxID=1311 RepID=A0AB74H115_STRAG|nr:Transcriptional regulator, RofA [Streptococcus agalactiae]
MCKSIVQPYLNVILIQKTWIIFLIYLTSANSFAAQKGLKHMSMKC